MATITINKENSIIGGFMLVLGLCVGLAIGFVGGFHRAGVSRFGNVRMMGNQYNTGYNTPVNGMMRTYQQRIGTRPAATTTPTQ